MNEKDALGIVTAVEETSDYFDREDHAQGVVSHALRQLGEKLADALGVPPCTCRWGHGSKSWRQQGDTCPRDGFGETLSDGTE